ncbi:hypothetical protein E2C01_033878 [Portunus trituberculatus]|uniref:Uncharacterized protein n=1 Tax=Portunus trituberculatus TaxID=210409 RepID=A0A5B7F1B0_PORTR|nr:hypothetical protein [Portunus trituberculatus]
MVGSVEENSGEKRHYIVHYSKGKFRGKSLVRNTADIGFGWRASRRTSNSGVAEERLVLLYCIVA